MFAFVLQPSSAIELCAGLQHLYPELGVDLGERAYGADCRLYIKGQGINWPVIKATLFDEFVVAHTVGWWCKVRLHSPKCSTSEMLVPVRSV